MTDSPENKRPANFYELSMAFEKLWLTIAEAMKPALDTMIKALAWFTELLQRRYLRQKLERFLPACIAGPLATCWPERWLPDSEDAIEYFTRKENDD